MRETPGQDHLEHWCLELTMGGVLLEADVDELARRAALEDKDARRRLRVAEKTHATRGPKRTRRYRKAAVAKTRCVYLRQLAQAVSSEELDVVGELSYAAAHYILAHANAFGEAWLKRQVAW